MVYVDILQILITNCVCKCRSVENHIFMNTL